MDKSWIHRHRCSPEYQTGLQSFLKYAFAHASTNGKILCPCMNCCNNKWHGSTQVKEHLTIKGWAKGYSVNKWLFHGELDNSNDPVDASLFEGDENRGVDDMQGMLHGPFGIPISEEVPEQHSSEPNPDAAKFYKLVKVVHRLGTDSYATKRAKMTMDNEGVEPSDFDLFIETHKEKENKQLDSSAKALVETMSQIPAGTPEDSAREQALKAITGGPSHGRIPLQGLFPPSMVVLKQKASLADSAMAAIEKVNRDSELAKRDAADSKVQVQILKERIDAMECAQKARDDERDAGLNAFIKKYNLMDMDALARDDSDAAQGEYDVDSVQPT